MSLFKKMFFLLSICVLAFAILACDNMDDSDDSDNDCFSSQCGVTVDRDGGYVHYGMTIPIEVNVSTDLPYTYNMTVNNWSNFEMGFFGVYDVTDMDSVYYHDGKISIGYADISSSFALDPDQSYPFTITLDNTAVANTVYRIDVGIMNKNGVTPNPYVFTVRFITNP